MRELYEDLDIVVDITKKKLEWNGHAVRMNHGSQLKKIFDSKADGSRRRGRPRLRWLEDVEEDLQEMKFKSWRQKAVGRAEWVSVI